MKFRYSTPVLWSAFTLAFPAINGDALARRHFRIVGVLSIAILLSMLMTSRAISASSETTTAAKAASVGATEQAKRETWRKTMARLSLPKRGCFKASYPVTEWKEVECGRPSPYSNQRRPAARGNEVGDGIDYVAQASGSNLISSAEGSFRPIVGVTGVSGVSGDIAFTSTTDTNIFMLQMNTQSEFNKLSGFNDYPSTFTTPACNGAPNGAAGCYGWQQFLFSQSQGPAPTAGEQSVPGATGTTPGVFIEYWLFNYGSPCPTLPTWAVPAGSPPSTLWNNDGGGDCWFNGPITYVPPQTAADLPGLVMTASSSASQDEVKLATTSGMYAYAEPNVLSVAQAWTQVEFNVFGDCCGSQTNFTSPTVLVVKTSINDGSTSPPICVANDGTTGETSNLTLAPTSAPVCCPYGGTEPSIEFMQTFDTAHTHDAWCAPTTIEGDPHIATADGTHYDFQAAGEFVTLRDPDGMEIQTRQKPVSTTFIGEDSHDGLTTCVSLNTAVAARVGEHRVTWEPNLSGVPDPTGLQLRIDGALTTLSPQGVALTIGGRVSAQAGGALQIDFPDGKTLLVTPQWWQSQSEWYLNVDVSHLGLVSGEDSGAGRGIAGAIASGSWLPALPGGASVGPMPATLPARYDTLYKKFADAWRVHDKDSLFDYAPGTSTASFTNKEWPLEKPPCVVRESKPLEPGSEALAHVACRFVADENRRANCIFDVRATGDTTFAKSYLTTQRILSRATTTSLTADADSTQVGEWVRFTASVVANSAGPVVPNGTVQFMVDGSKAAEPVTVNAKGSAIWETSRLKAGKHRVIARYIPSIDSVYSSSTSAEKVQDVERCNCRVATR